MVTYNYDYCPYRKPTPDVHILWLLNRRFIYFSWRSEKQVVFSCSPSSSQIFWFSEVNTCRYHPKVDSFDLFKPTFLESVADADTGKLLRSCRVFPTCPKRLAVFKFKFCFREVTYLYNPRVCASFLFYASPCDWLPSLWCINLPINRYNQSCLESGRETTWYSCPIIWIRQ